MEPQTPHHLSLCNSNRRTMIGGEETEDRNYYALLKHFLGGLSLSNIHTKAKNPNILYMQYIKL
jgi:hypothetical protein